MRRLASGLCLGAIAVLVLAGQAAAAPGDPDRSFGENGRVEVQQVLFPDGEHAMEVVGGTGLGPADETVVFSRAPVDCPLPSACPVDVAVTRYDAAGERDASFGSGGAFKARLDYPPAGLVKAPFSSALAVSPSGAIAIAATDGAGLRLIRLTAAGTPDPSFGGAGSVAIDWGGEAAVGGVLAYGDGSVLVAGSRTDASGSEAVLARFLPDGQPDPEFGTAGVATAQLGGVYRLDLVGGIGGRRFAVGSPLATHGQVSVFDPSGALDLGFDRDGTARVTGGPISVDAVLPAGGGRVLVVVSAHHGRHQEWATVLRLLPNGRPDSEFGRAGRVQLGRNKSGVDSRADAGAVLDRLGHVALGGYQSSKSFSGIWLRRLRLDGRVDRTFAGGRAARLPFGEGYGRGRGRGIGLASAGRIVLLAEESSCDTVCYPFDEAAPSRATIFRFRGGVSKVRCQGRLATIVGTDAAEKIVGTQGRDVIAALGGNDHVRGLGGDDLICGGSGRDKLLGGPGKNRVRQ
ncbi:MAG: hypothetical protein R2725_08145 [Solirubrobacterales bacterium]